MMPVVGAHRGRELYYWRGEFRHSSTRWLRRRPKRTRSSRPLGWRRFLRSLSSRVTYLGPSVGTSTPTAMSDS